jgi:DNA-directed RNA polymerase alpha subunit
MSITEEGDVVSEYPTVLTTEWCGEWGSREPAAHEHHIEDLQLSVRIRNAILGDGIRTAEELSTKTIGRVLGVSGIGKGSLQEIRGELGRLGLRLKNDYDENP